MKAISRWQLKVNAAQLLNVRKPIIDHKETSLIVIDASTKTGEVASEASVKAHVVYATSTVTTKAPSMDRVQPAVG
ncbi:hypothetical protein PI124_g22075 [Phytophthora idaei]|nr:hypothetical protein PI125_g22785 [Phytophthora idaei]KAG3129547.1 hypothetical protein PI126_g20915 [Phytophthora idaei]KAG3232849.1 hypothetical protein PI124_g22075 [Phytophthora idaei]